MNKLRVIGAILMTLPTSVLLFSVSNQLEPLLTTIVALMYGLGASLVVGGDK